MFRTWLLILALLTTRVEASDLPQAKKPASQKSKFNTQIFEKESETSSFTDTVKVIRTVADQTQVFFNSQKGTYFLETALDSGRAQNLLAMSQKNRVPVNVTINSDSRQILKVNVGESEAPPQ